MSDKPAWWKINRPKAGPDREPRLSSCRAYPTTGTITGPTVAWCQAARGAWCGKCQHLSPRSSKCA